MTTEVIACIAGVSAFVAAGVVWVAAGWGRNARQETVQSLPSEEPDQELRHSRLTQGATCFRCRLVPADKDGLWCADCAAAIHELDNNDQRTREEK